MKLDPQRHLDRTWRVHALAADFELLDVWSFPILADPADGETFDGFFELVRDNGMRCDGAIAEALFAIRARVGRWFGWDDPTARLPIPGCDEYSVVERLPPAERAATMVHVELADLTVVYKLADEALLEISNDTIHALIHLSWVPHDEHFMTPRMAVYIKSRGLGSDLYMALISPFRHVFVYPAWLGRIGRLFSERTHARLHSAA